MDRSAGIGPRRDLRVPMQNQFGVVLAGRNTWCIADQVPVFSDADAYVEVLHGTPYTIRRSASAGLIASIASAVIGSRTMNR